MRYENQTVVFPMGMKINANTTKEPNYHLHFETCKIKMQNRRKTLKAGNAVRLKRITEDSTFNNCTILLEGTLTADAIEPFAKHRCLAYVKEVL